MLTSTSLVDIFALGRLIQYLVTLYQEDAKVVADQIRVFLHLLDTCGLVDTKAAAQPLASIRLLVYPGTNSLHADTARQIAYVLLPVHAALQNEAGRKQMIALNQDGVSPRLRELPARLKLNDTQQHLLDETIRSIECEAYRSAVVMAWNLAYDFIRQWVFDNGLPAFNGALPTSRFPAINSYSDFWENNPAPSERTVLDTCRTANLFGNPVHLELIRHLRYRNNYAHANFKTPSTFTANAYTEELIDIITSPPFKT